MSEERVNRARQFMLGKLVTPIQRDTLYDEYYKWMAEFAESENAQLREKLSAVRPALESAHRAIDTLPESQLGYGMNTSTNIRWPLRDELIAQIEKALTIIDGNEAK